MVDTEIVHPAEQTLLLTLTLAICLCLYVDWGIKSIDEYNERVRIEQEQKLNLSELSTGRGKIDLCVDSYWWPWYPNPLSVQFLTLPLAFFILLSRKSLGLILVTDFNFFTLIGYLFWYSESIYSRDSQDGIDYELRSLNEFIFTGSSMLEFTAAILTAILFIIQLTFLYRYAADLIPKRIRLQ